MRTHPKIILIVETVLVGDPLYNPLPSIFWWNHSITFSCNGVFLQIMSLTNQAIDCQSAFIIESVYSKFFILNLISHTSPNLEIVTDWYIQLAFLYIALWKHDFKYLPTYSIALCKKNKKGWIFAHLHIEMLNERVWGKFSFRKDDLSQPFWPSKGNEALSSSLN